MTSTQFYKPPTRPPYVVYVAYAWSPKLQGWMLLGFVRAKRSLNIRKINKLRALYTLHPAVQFRAIELAVAAECGGAGPAPSIPTQPKPRKHVDIADLKHFAAPARHRHR